MALSKTSHVFLQPTTLFWAEFAQLVQVWRSLEGASKSFLTSQKTDFLWTGDEKTRCERRIVLVSVNGKLFRREKSVGKVNFVSHGTLKDVVGRRIRIILSTFTRVVEHFFVNLRLTPQTTDIKMRVEKQNQNQWNCSHQLATMFTEISAVVIVPELTSKKIKKWLL